MLTVITGTPGAGKTLHAIEKLLLPLVGKTITQRLDDGAEREIPRRIFTNIKGLQIEHDLIEEGGKWESKGGEWRQPEGSNREGLHNWHEWAPPGAVIVVDEFQKWWPPRPNGAAVPPDVQGLDTHRHMGVDFILITQNVMNADRHIHGLTGRHLHVRRIANMPFAIVYEWDHCSRTLMFSKAVSKSPWRYDKKVFKLYHSADLHTKQPRKTPALLWVVLAALGGAAWFIPDSAARILGKGDQAQALMAGHNKSALKAAPVGASGAAHVPGQAAAPVPVGSVVAAAPAVMGCISSASNCRCWGPDGSVLDLMPQACREASYRVGNLVAVSGGTSAFASPVPPAPMAPDASREAAASPQSVVMPGAGYGLAARSGSSAL